MYNGKILTFLWHAANSDLRVLCDIVTKEKDGSFRATETLSSTDLYSRCYPDSIMQMLPELFHEFRLFGGNSVLNFFRGEGPEYSMILRDVARKCGLSFNTRRADEDIELLLLDKLISDSLDGASDDELKQIMVELKVPAIRFNRVKAVRSLKTLWVSGSKPGYLLMVSVVTAVISQLAGKGLTIALSSTLVPVASVLLGPVGLILTSLYCVMDVAGPAYRVTIQAVIQISYIRQKYKFELLKK